jgi:rubrerythrin
MFRRLVETLVPGLGAQDSPTDATASPDGGVQSGLYRCENCQTTFIDTAMDDCPRCESEVEAVPTAADLGFDDGFARSR